MSMRHARRALRAAGLALAVGAAFASQAGARPKPKPVAPPPPPQPRPQDWKPVAPDDLLVIDTNKGRIVVALAPELAPASVARVQALARQHFYDGLSFFRVVDDFMDQTGDPKNTGEGGSTLPDLKAEFTFRRGRDVPFVPVVEPSGDPVGFLGPFPVSTQPDALMGMTVDSKVQASGLFCAGTAGMARATGPDSANSQFFLMRAAYPKLNGQYTPFGRVLVGQDVVKAIKVGEPVEAPQDRMTQVRLASDLPPSQRPVVRTLDTTSPAFAAKVEQARDEAGADFTICNVDVPVQAR